MIGPNSKTPRDPVKALLVARQRRAAHDLRAKGCSKPEIISQLDVARSTVEDWLLRPPPTDEELARLEARAAQPKAVNGRGHIGFRACFPPDVYDRLLAEAERQGAARVRIVDCAVQLYLDAMARARGEIEGPLNVKGYRV